MCRLACISLLLISSAGISAQSSVDPNLILARARQRLLTDLQRMPRYTCVETVTRNNYPAPLSWWHPSRSCAEIAAELGQHERKPKNWDRLRLDVAIGDQGEILSWVGAPRFEEGTLSELAGKGALVSGDFGPFLGAIFKVATVEFKAERIIDGRHVLEYSYDVPQQLSKYQVFDSNHKTWFITAYSGTFLLNRDDSDLVQLTIRTADLPRESGKCQAINEVVYGRVPIHGSEVLIPKEARLRVIDRSGEEALNRTSYANCREYSSKSVLRFNTSATDSNTSGLPPADPSSAFPPGLNFRWRVVTPIDSDTAAAGDPVEGTLQSSIRDQHGSVLAPTGAHIHGRLVQFSQFGGFWALALKFESIELNGATVPFNVALAADDKWSGIRLHGAKSSELVPGPARFFFYRDHLKLTQLESSGRTATPKEKANKNP